MRKIQRPRLEDEGEGAYAGIDEERDLLQKGVVGHYSFQEGLNMLSKKLNWKPYETQIKDVPHSVELTWLGRTRYEGAVLIDQTQRHG